MSYPSLVAHKNCLLIMVDVCTILSPRCKVSSKIHEDKTKEIHV